MLLVQETNPPFVPYSLSIFLVIKGSIAAINGLVGMLNMIGILLRYVACCCCCSACLIARNKMPSPSPFFADVFYVGGRLIIFVDPVCQSSVYQRQNDVKILCVGHEMMAFTKRSIAVAVVVLLCCSLSSIQC